MSEFKSKIRIGNGLVADQVEKPIEDKEKIVPVDTVNNSGLFGVFSTDNYGGKLVIGKIIKGPFKLREDNGWFHEIISMENSKAMTVRLKRLIKSPTFSLMFSFVDNSSFKITYRVVKIVPSWNHELNAFIGINYVMSIRNEKGYRMPDFEVTEKWLEEKVAKETIRKAEYPISTDSVVINTDFRTAEENALKRLFEEFDKKRSLHITRPNNTYFFGVDPIEVDLNSPIVSHLPLFTQIRNTSINKIENENKEIKLQRKIAQIGRGIQSGGNSIQYRGDGITIAEVSS